MSGGKKSGNDNNQPSKLMSSGPFKWFVLVTYVIFSASLAMSELIFAPIPNQTAAYYGIKGTYFENFTWKKIFQHSFINY